MRPADGSFTNAHENIRFNTVEAEGIHIRPVDDFIFPC
jgi:hypothetical protein